MNDHLTEYQRQYIAATQEAYEKSMEHNLHVGDRVKVLDMRYAHLAYHYANLNNMAPDIMGSEHYV